VPFDADIIQWPTLDAFKAYLATKPRPAWVRGLTNHNTYIPNETQWRGIASVRSCMQTYIGKGWSAGPNLFLAAEAPNPAHRGIFQLTPITHPGVHAGQCNADHLGIENVGDFDARPPTPAQYQLLLAVNRAILEWWKLPPASVNVHNECMPGRTCPGRHLTGVQIRGDLASGVTPAPPLIGRFRFVVPQSVFTSRDPNAPLAAGPTVFKAGDIVEVGDITAGWAWIRTGIGFVPLSTVVKL
jgi:hypothetical protein